jgi:uncharacterized heparinase superfamily protein
VTRAGTYWRTVRHLKPAQITDRISFRLRRPRADLRPPPPRRPVTGRWVPPARRGPSLEAPVTFDLLGERHALDAVGWDGPAVSRLWRYHQHYFDDLHAHGAAGRRALHATLVERWIAENPPGSGPGWEPYPLSLRIVRWIQWLLNGNEAPRGAVASLAVQARWLAQRLETHLLGNHLFANAKALVFAGLFFAGDEASQWLRTGSAVLLRELPEQILADGGQFERSPMYHALALEDVLDLLAAIAAFDAGEVASAPLREELVARVPAMLRWLAAMTHPDGTLGRFNDCADGVASSNAELFRYAAELGFAAPAGPRDDEVVVLRESGYVRVARGPAVALLDVAPIGPDYLPGHAHADTLSFELSLAGQRIVVNGGTSCYGDGPQRQRERGTAAHSTVEVAGENSSEVWAGFRVGRRARVDTPRIERAGDVVQVSAAHDGYAHLPKRPIHRRAWEIDARGMTVSDGVGSPGTPALARFHLAPGLSLASTGGGRWRVTAGATALADVDVIVGDAREEPSFHAPRFGVVEPTVCLAVALAGGRAVTRWTWSA